MRWFVLLAVLAGIFWTANWSYHQMDQAVLITDYWQAQENLEQWGLVNFEGNEPKIYAFNSTKGYWNIFKGLWPIWTLFILSFFVLVPFSIYIFNGLNNAQIAAAKEAQRDAEERVRKAESNAKSYEQQAKSWAEERVSSAYEVQEKRIRAELDNETQYLHQFKNELIQREQLISGKENAVTKAQQETKDQIIEIKRLYA
ncbi:hypothetical protein, partial [Vibrio rotiferianus]